jgi:hypothetical protein
MALSLKMHRVLHHAEDGVDRAQKTQRERERTAFVEFTFLEFDLITRM